MITLKADDSLAVRIARLEEWAKGYREMGMWNLALDAEMEAAELQRRLRDAMKPERKRPIAPFPEAAHGRRTTYDGGCRCPGCMKAMREYHRWYRSLANAQAKPGA